MWNSHSKFAHPAKWYFLSLCSDTSNTRELITLRTSLFLLHGIQMVRKWAFLSHPTFLPYKISALFLVLHLEIHWSTWNRHEQLSHAPSFTGVPLCTTPSTPHWAFFSLWKITQVRWLPSPFHGPRLHAYCVQLSMTFHTAVDIG